MQVKRCPVCDRAVYVRKGQRALCISCVLKKLNWKVSCPDGKVSCYYECDGDPWKCPRLSEKIDE